MTKMEWFYDNVPLNRYRNIEIHDLTNPPRQQIQIEPMPDPSYDTADCPGLDEYLLKDLCDIVISYRYDPTHYAIRSFFYNGYYGPMGNKFLICDVWFDIQGRISEVEMVNSVFGSTHTIMTFLHRMCPPLCSRKIHKYGSVLYSPQAFWDMIRDVRTDYESKFRGIDQKCGFLFQIEWMYYGINSKYNHNREINGMHFNSQRHVHEFFQKIYPPYNPEMSNRQMLYTTNIAYPVPERLDMNQDQTLRKPNPRQFRVGNKIFRPITGSIFPYQQIFRN